MLPMGAGLRPSNQTRTPIVGARAIQPDSCVFVRRANTECRMRGLLNFWPDSGGPTQRMEKSSTTLCANSLRAAPIYALLSSDASLYVLLQAVGELWLNIID